MTVYNPKNNKKFDNSMEMLPESMAASKEECKKINRLNDEIDGNYSIAYNTGVSPVYQRTCEGCTTWADPRWTDKERARRILKKLQKN